jgi:hypothetical protein
MIYITDPMDTQCQETGERLAHVRCAQTFI